MSKVSYIFIWVFSFTEHRNLLSTQISKQNIRYKHAKTIFSVHWIFLHKLKILIYWFSINKVVLHYTILNLSHTSKNTWLKKAHSLWTSHGLLKYVGSKKRKIHFFLQSSAHQQIRFPNFFSKGSWYFLTRSFLFSFPYGLNAAAHSSHSWTSFVKLFPPPLLKVWFRLKSGWFGKPQIVRCPNTSQAESGCGVALPRPSPTSWPPQRTRRTCRAGWGCSCRRGWRWCGRWRGRWRWSWRCSLRPRRWSSPRSPSSWHPLMWLCCSCFCNVAYAEARVRVKWPVDESIEVN